jgi:hypothetical protein
VTAHGTWYKGVWDQYIWYQRIGVRVPPTGNKGYQWWGWKPSYHSQPPVFIISYQAVENPFAGKFCPGQSATLLMGIGPADLHPRSCLSGIWIEMKRSRGNPVDRDETAWKP